MELERIGPVANRIAALCTAHAAYWILELLGLVAGAWRVNAQHRGTRQLAQTGAGALVC